MRVAVAIILLVSLSLTANCVQSVFDEASVKSRALQVLLDYLYAGEHVAGWSFFDREYTFPDKLEIRKRIKKILKRQPVYRFLSDRKP